MAWNGPDFDPATADVEHIRRTLAALAAPLAAAKMAKARQRIVSDVTRPGRLI